MKQKFLKILCLAGATVSAGWLTVYGLMMFLVNRALETEAASIGVIGGADGPTAIFVTTSGPDWDLVIAGAVLIVSLIGYWYLRRKKA